MLSFMAALAFVEMGAGVVMSEAWRQRQQGTGSSIALADLDQMLERLRVVESAVAVGAVATAMLWSFLAVDNAARAGRNTRSVELTVAAWVLAPAALVALGQLGDGHRSARLDLVVLAAQAIVLYLPFVAIGSTAARVGGRRTPFLSWYLSVLLAFLVHQAFTGSTRLAETLPSEDLGRATSMALVNSMVMGMVVLMAADASRGMQQATVERAYEHNQQRAEALTRFGVTATGEQRVPPWADFTAPGA